MIQPLLPFVPKPRDGTLLLAPPMIKNNIPNPNVTGVIIYDTYYSESKIEIVSLDSRITYLFGERIAAFIELAAKHGDIDQRCAQQVRSQFEHTFPELQSNKLPSLSQMRKLYAKLYSQIEKTILQARENGKKVLIVPGENHIDRKSLIIECMVMDIVNQLGIRRLLTETSRDGLAEFKTETIDSILSPNFLYVLKLAEEYGFEIIPCDPECDGAIMDRFNAINRSIIQSNGDCVFIVGAGHLGYICQDKDIQRNYEVLSINASNLGEKLKSDFMFLLSPLQYPGFNYFSDPVHTMQVDVPGNPYSLDFKLIRMSVEFAKQSDPSTLIHNLSLQKGLQGEVRFSAPPAATIKAVTDEKGHNKTAKNKSKIIDMNTKQSFSDMEMAKIALININCKTIEPNNKSYSL